jgi:uncharacterized Zn finger protein (UPF0148 family)
MMSVVAHRGYRNLIGGSTMKTCQHCGIEIYTKDGDNLCQACEDRLAMGKRPTKRAHSQRRGIDNIMADLGLVKVRGALGGTYYE